MAGKDPGGDPRLSILCQESSDLTLGKVCDIAHEGPRIDLDGAPEGSQPKPSGDGRPKCGPANVRAQGFRAISGVDNRDRGCGPDDPGSGADVDETRPKHDWQGYRIPRKIARTGHHQVVGFSDGESEDTGGISGSEGSDRVESDDSVTSSFKSRRTGKSRSSFSGVSKPQKTNKLTDDTIFDPFAKNTVETLTNVETEFMVKYVCDPLWNPQLLDDISEQFKVPTVVAEAVRKPLDPEILDMLPHKVSPFAKENDKAFLSISTRLGTAFGPLSKVWSDLRKARDTKNTQFDLASACTTIEQGMFVLGQAHNAILFARRKALLSTFFRDKKKAGDIVKRNQHVFNPDEEFLFGSHFYDSLHRKAKGTKRLREAQWELSRRKRRFRFNKSSNDSRTQTQGYNTGSSTRRDQAASTGNGQKPFRGRSHPNKGRGGGRGTAKPQNSA